MSQHEPLVRLKHMRDYAREALQLFHGKTRADLDKDRLLTLALTHLVELIGESASWVSEEIQRKNPRAG